VRLLHSRSSMGVLLRLENASFGYGGQRVLSGVDLALEPGEFLGIVGPNGAGKTTLFRGLLGLIAPLSGRVERAHVAIGYVPQREGLDALFPISVEEVVHMGAYGRLAGLRRLIAEERALVRNSLERVGLADLGRLPFASLSGGQRQRVLIARALMVRPRMLLLDEPTSGVDRAARQAIQSLLGELHAREEMTILLVSHDLSLLQASAREVLLVSEGRVVRRRTGELTPESLDPSFTSLGAG